MTNFEESYEKSFSAAYEKEEQKFKDIVNKKLIISLIGDVNVGKSETINALTGRKLSEVSAFAGETKIVSLHDYSENVSIADTPGLNDINPEISKKATDFVHEDADIIIFFINAAVGANKAVIDTFHNLQKLNKPIITVLNKIDIWFEDGRLVEVKDYETVVSQIEKETNQKPIAISAKKKINIMELNNKILETLQKSGKDILFLKISKFREEQVKQWIKGSTTAAFGIGIIPIPGADIIPLTSLQVGLALKIAYIYNCKVNKDDVMALLASTVTGSAGKTLFKLGSQALKGLGWLGGPITEGAVVVFAGTVAASVTFAFGWACNTYYKSGMTVDLKELGVIYKQRYDEYFNENNKFKGSATANA